MGSLFYAEESLNTVNIYRKDAYEEIDPKMIQWELVKVFER